MGDTAPIIWRSPWEIKDPFGLINIIIPADVTDIGKYPFLGRINLQSIEVDTANRRYSSLDGVLFDKDKTELIVCPGTKTGAYVILPSVTSIRECAFSCCSSLTSITISDSVTSIGSLAFFGCEGLTNITIPNGVTNIGIGAFVHCTNLTGIEVDAANEMYSSPDGVLFDKGRTELIAYPGGKTGAYVIPPGTTNIKELAFAACCSLTSIEIPDSVTSIGGSAFKNCINLTSIEIPSSVMRIECNTFEDCERLTSIVFAGSKPPQFEENCFAYTLALEKICVPRDAYDAYVFALSGHISCDVEIESL